MPKELFESGILFFAFPLLEMLFRSVFAVYPYLYLNLYLYSPGLWKSLYVPFGNLNLDLHNYARLILFTAHCLLSVLLFLIKAAISLARSYSN